MTLGSGSRNPNQSNGAAVGAISDQMQFPQEAREERYAGRRERGPRPSYCTTWSTQFDHSRKAQVVVSVPSRDALRLLFLGDGVR